VRHLFCLAAETSSFTFFKRDLARPSCSLKRRRLIGAALEILDPISFFADTEESLPSSSSDPFKWVSAPPVSPELSAQQSNENQLIGPTSLISDESQPEEI